MRRLPVIALLLILLAAPVTASAGDEVTAFGFSDARHRLAAADGPAISLVWRHDGGPSYSQPLILSGDRWGGGLAGKTLAVTVENNTLNGYVLPDVGIELPEWREIDPVWSVKLSGSVPTKSHPTLVESGGGKYIYIGTYSRYFNIVDITDFRNVVSKKAIDTIYTTDITSAPLVLGWRGHEVVVATSGNTAKVILIADPRDEGRRRVFWLNAGAGRTSSSPAPVGGGRGFAVGLDQGANSGELRIYYLDDILAEKNGKVVLKNQSARKAIKTDAGLSASFAADGDVLYFGDSRSNVYAVNVATGQRLWKNTDYRGIFSNRSPALTPQRVYFPAVGYPGGEGKLLAIDRADGSTAWAMGMMESRAMTAPVVLGDAGGKLWLYEGTSEGGLAIIEDQGPLGEGFLRDYLGLSEVRGYESYASGISGEISIGRGWMIVTTEQGVIGVRLTDLNFAALSIDPGVPAGELARPGMVYKGKAVLRYDGPYYVSPILGAGFIPGPVGVLLDDGYLKLYDEQGQELPKMNWGRWDLPAGKSPGEDFYFLGMEPGKEYAVYFDWTFPAGAGEAVLKGYINQDIPPVQVPLYYLSETNREDNEVTARVEAGLPDLEMVSLAAPPGPLDPVKKFTLTARVRNNSSRPVSARVVVRRDGDPGSDYDERLDFAPGEVKTVRAETAGRSNMRYTYRAVVDPDNEIAESDETNNEKTAEVRMAGPNTQPVENPSEGGVRLSD